MHGGVELGGGKAAWCPKNGPPRRPDLRSLLNSYDVAFQMMMHLSIQVVRTMPASFHFVTRQISVLQAVANDLIPYVGLGSLWLHSIYISPI